MVKTTLARSITGVIAPTAKIVSGEILYKDINILDPINSTRAHNIKMERKFLSYLKVQ